VSKLLLAVNSMKHSPSSEANS